MISIALTVLFAPLLVWWSLWLLFALLALLPGRKPADARPGGTVIDILIPAHNEEILLPRLLDTLRLQTSRGRIGRTLVVADHCTDRTASLARAGHSDVLERQSGPRGKPAALRDGLAWLEQRASGSSEKGGQGGSGVLILDADCTVSPNLVEQCARALDAGASVVQAAYILDDPRTAATGKRLHAAAHLAFALKNLVRPRGMARVGIPTQLFGTGMCFRADVLSRLSFSDHLTEDLAISHDLLTAGTAPQFLPAALVRSPLPTERTAMSTQKLRWETGQLQTWTKLPVMLLSLLSRARLRAAVALIDWSAPPVAMAVLYWLGATFAEVVLVALRYAAPWTLILPAVSIACLVAYVIIGGVQVSGWAGVARLFLGVPRFLFWKLALYGQMLRGRGPRSWQRTPRSQERGVACGK